MGRTRFWPYPRRRARKLCIDVRLPPNVLPVEVFHELRGIIRKLQAGDKGLKMDVEIYASNPGVDIPHDHPTIRVLAKAHRAVFRKRPKVECSVYISDACHLNRYGIATVNYGGGGRLRTGGWFDPQEGGAPTASKTWSGRRRRSFQLWIFAQRGGDQPTP